MKIINIFIILLFTSKLFAGAWIEINNNFFPTQVDSSKIEKKLWKYLTLDKNIQFKEKKSYTYQFKRIDELNIKINALCNIYNHNTLNQYFIQVKDGGTCYFRIEYNLLTGGFKNLAINGEA